MFRVLIRNKSGKVKSILYETTCSAAEEAAKNRVREKREEEESVTASVCNGEQVVVCFAPKGMFVEACWISPNVILI